MVSAVTGSISNSLSQLLANSSAAAPAATTTAATGTSSGSGSSTAGTSATSTAQSLVSSLLSGGAYSSSVLSLLQENSSGSFDPVSSLLGGSGTSDAITGLYSSLYSTVASATVTQAKDQYTPATTGTASGATGTTSAQSLIASQTAASVAYNQTIQQNAATVANANAYGPNGVTKLVG